jgi:hypothetical protein
MLVIIKAKVRQEVHQFEISLGYTLEGLEVGLKWSTCLASAKP